MESRLSKLISVQASQELQVSKLTTETYSLLQSYNDLVSTFLNLSVVKQLLEHLSGDDFTIKQVNSLSENLAQLELKVSTTKKPK